MLTVASVNEISAAVGELSPLRTRELCLSGLRMWYSTPQRSRDDFDVHSHLVTNGILRTLADAGRINRSYGPAGSSLQLTEPYMRHVVEFVAWLIRVGIALPLGAEAGRLPRSLHLTASGHRYLASKPDDHPLEPGFLDRVAARCAGIPNDVLALLADASSCIDGGLSRAAIVLIGVADETAIEHVVENLVTKGLLPASVAEEKAARRIAAVRVLIDSNGTAAPDRQIRASVRHAYQFADQLRDRRNDASHTVPTYGFDDAAEAEEFLVSAGRHLPYIWRMRQV